MKNGNAIYGNLKSLDYLSFGLVGMLVALILAAFDNRLARDKKWMLSVIPVLCLAVNYWTTYCYDQRYYGVLLPFFLALAFGLAGLTADKLTLSVGSRNCIFVLGAFSFTLLPLKGTVHLVRHREGQSGLLLSPRNGPEA